MLGIKLTVVFLAAPIFLPESLSLGFVFTKCQASGHIFYLKANKNKKISPINFPKTFLSCSYMALSGAGLPSTVRLIHTFQCLLIVAVRFLTFYTLYNQLFERKGTKFNLNLVCIFSNYLYRPQTACCSGSAPPDSTRSRSFCWRCRMSPDSSP